MKPTNRPLYIPDAPSRPNITPDFSYLEQFSHNTKYYPIDTPAKEMQDAAYSLLQILDKENKLEGAWQIAKTSLTPHYTDELAKKALQLTITTRAFDTKLLNAQRQSKLSFYMQSLGEEICSIAPALALNNDDLIFPSYRQQGLLIARGRPLVDMICHNFSNEKDNLQGRQLPVHYSWPEGYVFTISGNLGTQCPQAVGAAMAAQIKNTKQITATFIGDGTSSEGDFHAACVFAKVYKAPVIIYIVNNQWAISTTQNIASGENTTFAAKAIGYDLAGLRVDGNDFFAVYTATLWAAKRAREKYGATIIELVTHRSGAHSTSDDPTKYRSGDEAKAFPLGDPLQRLKSYLINKNLWTEEQHIAYEEEAKITINKAFKEAEKFGTLHDGHEHAVEKMFDKVYTQKPWHLIEQEEEAKAAFLTHPANKNQVKK